MPLKGQYKGIFFALFGAFVFSIRLCLIKAVPLDQTADLVFFRFLFDFFILLPFFFKYRQSLKTEKIRCYLWRSILITLSLYCSTYGVKHLALTDSVLLQYTFPLFIPLFLFIFYKKKIALSSRYALFIGFSSLFFLLRPQLDIFHFASIASLSVGCIAAVLAVSAHHLLKTDHVIAYLFYGTLIPGILSFFPFIYSAKPISFSIFYLYLIPGSFLGVLHQYLASKAYALAPPHLVASFSYFCVLFSTFFNWLFWGETLSYLTVIGGGILVVSSLLMIYKNNQLVLEESRSG